APAREELAAALASPSAPPGEPSAPPAAPGPQPDDCHPASGGGWEITCAAVLGRPGEAEPVAAALALALSRGAGARAATVVVLAAGDAEPAHPATGGTRASRRLAERLGAHHL